MEAARDTGNNDSHGVRVGVSIGYSNSEELHTVAEASERSHPKAPSAFNEVRSPPIRG